MRYSSRAAKSKVISAGAVEPILRFFEAGPMVDILAKKKLVFALGYLLSAKVLEQTEQKFGRGNGNGERFHRECG